MESRKGTHPFFVYRIPYSVGEVVSCQLEAGSYKNRKACFRSSLFALRKNKLSVGRREREEKHVPWGVHSWIGGDAENGAPQRPQRKRGRLGWRGGRTPG